MTAQEQDALTPAEIQAVDEMNVRGHWIHRGRVLHVLIRARRAKAFTAEQVAWWFTACDVPAEPARLAARRVLQRLHARGLIHPRAHGEWVWGPEPTERTRAA